jgi:beta-phosphoglucomutase-like phosphatase (HAD superfamily)
MTLDLEHTGARDNYCSVVIFDLDNTLHNAVDKNDIVFERLGNDVISILNLCKLQKIKIALASLNTNATFFLEKLGIYHYFDCIQVKLWTLYGKDKTDLFHNISKQLNTSFENMLFFDDNHKHIIEARHLNIKTIKVDESCLLTINNFRDGLKLFKNKKYKHL